MATKCSSSASANRRFLAARATPTASRPSALRSPGSSRGPSCCPPGCCCCCCLCRQAAQLSSCCAVLSIAGRAAISISAVLPPGPAWFTLAPRASRRCTGGQPRWQAASRGKLPSAGSTQLVETPQDSRASSSASLPAAACARLAGVASRRTRAAASELLPAPAEWASSSACSSSW